MHLPIARSLSTVDQVGPRPLARSSPLPMRGRVYAPPLCSEWGGVVRRGGQQARGQGIRSGSFGRSGDGFGGIVYPLAGRVHVRPGEGLVSGVCAHPIGISAWSSGQGGEAFARDRLAAWERGAARRLVRVCDGFDGFDELLTLRRRRRLRRAAHPRLLPSPAGALDYPAHVLCAR